VANEYEFAIEIDKKDIEEKMAGAFCSLRKIAVTPAR
jgi:hypothetical protein